MTSLGVVYPQIRWPLQVLAAKTIGSWSGNTEIKILITF